MKSILKKIRSIELSWDLMFNIILVLVLNAIAFVFAALFSWNEVSVLTFWILIITYVSGTSLFFIFRIYRPALQFRRGIALLKSSGFEEDDLEKIKINSKISKEIIETWNQIRGNLNLEYSESILKNQAEINALQSQINPHFLYNTLESIRGKALMADMEEIAEMTEALATFFRYSISQKGNIVTLWDEIKNVQNYFKIQKFRFNDRFELAIIYDEIDEDILDFKIPKLTLQPIVENSIYHGLESKIGKGKIEIRILRTEKRLIISVIDEGVGIQKEKLLMINKSLTSNLLDVQSGNSKKGGIALINVNQRIKLFFGDEYGLRITSTVNVGTEVELVIPLVKDEAQLLVRKEQSDD